MWALIYVHACSISPLSAVTSDSSINCNKLVLETETENLSLSLDLTHVNAHNVNVALQSLTIRG